jgi:hypothetical protein
MPGPVGLFRVVILLPFDDGLLRRVTSFVRTNERFI